MGTVLMQYGFSLLIEITQTILLNIENVKRLSTNAHNIQFKHILSVHCSNKVPYNIRLSHYLNKH